MTTKWTKSLIDDIIDKIKDGKVVPIIGPDAYYIDDEEDVPVQKYVVEKLIENCGPIDFDDLDSDDKRLLHEGDFRSMTLLKKKLGSNLRRKLKDFYDNARANKLIKLKPQVREFLEYGKFPLILTTYQFNFIDLLCYEKEYSYVSYRCGQNKDQDIVPDADFQKLKERPIVFQLFGTIGSDKIVVLTENDFLKYLHCYHNINKYPVNLKEYLEDKYVLSLGSNIPDWTARFLLYSLKETDFQNEGEAGSDSFDGGFISMTLGKDLSKFLNRISYFSHTDFKEFLGDINKKFTDRRRLNLFVSLDSKEYDTIGAKMKKRLSDTFEVKIYKDFASHDYWKAINTKISECDVAVVIVTPNSLLKLWKIKKLPTQSSECRDEIPGLITEWMIIKEQNKPCTIVLNGVDISDLREAIREKDPEKNVLWPLFFPEEGNEAIELKDVANLTAASIMQRISKKTSNTAQR